jgi:hypothetical protein
MFGLSIRESSYGIFYTHPVINYLLEVDLVSYLIATLTTTYATEN